MITRRNCILSGLGAAVSARISSGAEFWNSKEPAEWSEEDISRVLNKSPWAKETTIHFRQDLMSGPAGGMTATEHIAGALGETNVLTLDMGGTSADVGILVGGAQRHTTEYEIEWGLPAEVPVIDIKSIGAGGGSIAWVAGGGFLLVGPRSAGAEPGPIC